MISKRKAIDAFRKTTKVINQTLSIDELKGSMILSDNADVETTITNNETKEILIKEINALGEPDSEIFIRKYFFGQKTKTIANELHLKRNTVDKKISRGLEKLRISLGGVL